MRRPQSAQIQKIMLNRPKDELIDVKQQLNYLNEENKKLKTTNMQLKRQLMKYEHIDENLINSQQLLGRVSDQPSIIPSLKYKIRIQQNEIDMLKQQLTTQQKQMKMTSIQELQFQIQNYQEETIKLKQMLDDAIGVNTDTKKNQYLTYLSKISELKIELKQYSQICDNQQREIKQLQNQIKKQQDQMQNYNSERKKMETQFNEQQQLLQTSLLSQQQLQQKSVVFADTKRKDEQQDQFQGSYTFQQQLQEKDRTIQDLTDNLNSINKSHLGKINSQLQFIEQQNAQLETKKYIIQNLESEIDKLKNEIKDIKLKNTQMLRSKQTYDQQCQFPILAYQNVDAIKNTLKFRLKRAQIDQKEISNYIIQNDDQKFLSISTQFQKFPFNLNSEEAYTVTTFLLSTEESALSNKNLEKDLPLSVLKSRILHLLPHYDLINIEQEGQFFSSISKRILTQLNSIAEQIKQIKRMERSTLSIKYCLPSQFQDATKSILDNPLNQKEIDYILQLSFEMTNEPLLIDIQKVMDIFQLKPSQELLVQKKELVYIQPQIYFSYLKESVIKPKRFSVLSSPNAGSFKQDKSGIQRNLKLNQAFIVISCQPKINLKQKRQLSLNKIQSYQYKGIPQHKSINQYTQTLKINLIDFTTQTNGPLLQTFKAVQIQHLSLKQKTDFSIQCSIKDEKQNVQIKNETKLDQVQPNSIIQKEKKEEKQIETTVNQSKPIQNAPQENVSKVMVDFYLNNQLQKAIETTNFVNSMLKSYFQSFIQ